MHEASIPMMSEAGENGADTPTLARFRALVTNSADAIVLSDEENVITFVTPAILAQFGYSPDALIGVSGFSFVHPSDRPASIDSARSLLAHPGMTTRQIFRLRHANGSYRWIQCTSVNLLDHESVRGILNTFRDINEQKEADDRIRSSEERMAALLRNADGAIIVADRTGHVDWASPSAESLWGLPGASLTGRLMTELIHVDDVDDVVREFTKLIERPTGSTARLEARMYHGDGTVRWYESIFTNCLDTPSVRGIVANVRDTTDRALAEIALRDSQQRLDHQATHDPLTDLPNRTLLLDRLDMALARSQRNDRGVAVLFCDLDNFKVINDSQGHSHGDQLLVGVAERLEAAIRPGDTIARFGGDELIVVAEDLHDTAEADQLARRLAQALEAPFRISGSEVHVTMSVGIAHAHAGVPGAETLIRNADAAMYQAKSRGRGRAEVFDDAIRARAVERHQIETALRRAVARRQLQVHFQPLIDLRHDRLAGFEALVRWKHPTRGMLHPGTFMAIAEETGLIVPLGSWIFDQACAQLARWQHDFDEDLFVAVNLSARQLADPTLVGDIAGVLSTTEVPPGRVHLEITESVLMDDVDASRDVLDRLKVLGVRVAIDDFGTGYSSFSYLRRFPVDILKIDQSFVQGLGHDPESDAIVESLIDLGHTIGLDVVAEGVETPTQLEELHRHGCDFVQGYLVSRPVPAAVITEHLRSGTMWSAG